MKDVGPVLEFSDDLIERCLPGGNRTEETLKEAGGTEVGGFPNDQIGLCCDQIEVGQNEIARKLLFRGRLMEPQRPGLEGVDRIGFLGHFRLPLPGAFSLIPSIPLICLKKAVPTRLFFVMPPPQTASLACPLLASGRNPFGMVPIFRRQRGRPLRAAPPTKHSPSLGKTLSPATVVGRNPQPTEIGNTRL